MSDDARAANWPVCIAIQEQNYLAVRPVQMMADSGCRVGMCVVDFTKATNEQTTGTETGQFIEIYSSVLGEPRYALFAEDLYSWFNKLPIDDNGKAWVTPDGHVQFGKIAR